MNRPSFPYQPKELEVVDEVASLFGTKTLVKNTPVTLRRNAEAMFFEKQPFFMAQGSHFRTFTAGIYTNNLGRGHGADIVDAFGIHWKYEPTAGGSIVVGGDPKIPDLEHWQDYIQMPDIDSWDWEGAAKAAKLDPRFPTYFSFSNGFWFERLISFMDFMPAAMALIDDELTDSLNDLFDATTELGCKLVDKFCEYFPQMDCIEVHDDWGSQKAPFFSSDVAEELFVPHMKKFTDRVHANGRVAMLHSCGHNVDRVQSYINAGFDYWTPQTMNDVKKLYTEFGDKIVIGVFPEEQNIAQLPEADQRRIAREFADFYNQPGKPATLGITGERMVTPVFMEELYEYTRKLYLNR